MYNRSKYGGGLEQKTWNMDAMFTERINTRLNELDIATQDANQTGRYRILYTIFMDTHFKYLDKVQGIKEKFEYIKKVLETSPKSFSKSVQAQHLALITTKAEGLLNDLTFEIIYLLYESDLICLKKVQGLNPELEFERDYA